MRIINGLIYIVIAWAIAELILYRKNRRITKFGEWLQCYPYLIIMLCVVNSVSFALTFYEKTGDITIYREGFGGAETQAVFQLKKEETTEDYTLTVLPRQYDDKTVNKKMKEPFEYLELHMKGENKSLQKVEKDLIFSLDPEEFPFDMEVQPLQYSLIDETGKVKNTPEELTDAGYEKKEIQKGIETELRITLQYGKIEQEKVYKLRIYQRETTSMQKIFAKVKEEIQAEEEKQEQEDHFTIPMSMDGVMITRTDENSINAMQVLIFGCITMALLVFRQKEQEREKEKIRKRNLLRSYPWFVNEMVLMLGAGMQVKHIFEQMIREYENKKKEDMREPLIRELVVAKRGFELGMSEEQIYYQLGRRLQLNPYIKLMTLLEQNVVRGTKGLTDIFEQQEHAALEERKNLAKKYGEEAGTKLLGPMILLLVIVMMMIMIPAFMSF